MTQELKLSFVPPDEIYLKFLKRFLQWKHTIFAARSSSYTTKNLLLNNILNYIVGNLAELFSESS